MVPAMLSMCKRLSTAGGRAMMGPVLHLLTTGALGGSADAGPIVDGPITGSEVLRAAVVLAVTLALALAARAVLVRALDRGDSDRYAGRLLGRFLSLLVVAVGLVYALGTVGVRITPLLGALGVGGIALALALQDVLQNFVAGVLLLVRRPFRVGHEVELGEYQGRVEDVNLRTVVVTTYDGLTVYLPNATVLKNPIVNLTRTPLSRTSLSVGVAYDTDLARAQQVLRDACAAAEGVAAQPGVEVWAEEFADSAITFAVRYWHDAAIATRWRVRSAVALSVKAALDDAGITIPFPQRTLWLGGADDAALAAALTGRARGTGEGRVAPGRVDGAGEQVQHRAARREGGT